MNLATRLSRFLATFSVLLFAVISFHGALLAQWEPDRRLSTTDTSARLNENMGQCLAVSGDTVHAVWWDVQNNGSAIFYKHSFDGGVSWGADTRLTASPSKADFPSIAVTGGGVHVVYRDASGSQNITYYKRSLDGGTSWGHDVSLGDYYWWPSLAASASMVFVALNDNNPGNTEVYCRRSTDNGATWNTVNQISNAPGRSEDPSIAAGGGCVHLAWNDNRTGIMQTYYRRSSDQGVTWGPETRLTDSPVFAYCPMLFVNGSDVNLAWADRRSGTLDIYFNQSADFGSTWGNEKQLSPEGPNAVYPVVARDGSNVHVVWWNMNADMVYTHSVDGGKSWGQPVSLVGASSKPTNPFIVASGTVLHVIWTDQRDGHPAIYYKRDPSGNSTVAGIVSGGTASTPVRFSLSVFPNPFNPSATVEFSLPVESLVTLHVYDLLGREVARLFDGERRQAGLSSVVFDASVLSSGVYLCRLDAGPYTTTTKIFLVK